MTTIVENGVRRAATSAELAELSALNSAWEDAAGQRMADAISQEAERRIGVGKTISGVQFKCDNDSITRLVGLIRRAEAYEAAQESVSITFMTASGATVTVTSSAQAVALRAAADAFQEHILTTSSALQVSALADELAEGFDPAADGNWTES